jgi:hypothetical protein
MRLKQSMGELFKILPYYGDQYDILKTAQITFNVKDLHRERNPLHMIGCISRRLTGLVESELMKELNK